MHDKRRSHVLLELCLSLCASPIHSSIHRRWKHSSFKSVSVIFFLYSRKSRYSDNADSYASTVFLLLSRVFGKYILSHLLSISPNCFVFRLIFIILICFSSYNNIPKRIPLMFHGIYGHFRGVIIIMHCLFNTLVSHTLT